MKIFLAHASEDKALVRDLHSRLLFHGFKPWLDEVDLLPGQTWRTAIPKAIRESDIFIACLSQRSVQKQGYIQREFRLALETYAEKPPDTIYLIPLMLDKCEIPDLELPTLGISLRDFQWLDFWKDGGFDRLILSIETARKSANIELTVPVSTASDLDAETSRVPTVESALPDSRIPSVSDPELETQAVEPRDTDSEMLITKPSEDDLTSEQKARRKFLKLAGLGSIGLLGVAVSYPTIFKPNYPESKPAFPPKPTESAPRILEDHSDGQIVGAIAGMHAGIAICALGVPGVGLLVSPVCGIAGAAAGFLVGSL